MRLPGTAGARGRRRPVALTRPVHPDGTGRTGACPAGRERACIGARTAPRPGGRTILPGRGRRMST